MKVSILYIKEPGTLSKERIVLKVLARADIGNYLLCDMTYTEDGEVSNKLRHPYWFPDRIVNPGDFVVLYTKGGIDSIVKSKSGTSSHFFYWGLEETVWNQDGDGATLFEIAEWIAKRVPPSN